MRRSAIDKKRRNNHTTPNETTLHFTRTQGAYNTAGGLQEELRSIRTHTFMGHITNGAVALPPLLNDSHDVQRDTRGDYGQYLLECHRGEVILSSAQRLPYHHDEHRAACQTQAYFPALNPVLRARYGFSDDLPDH